MNIELINTGTELMLGFVTNTNQQWLCRQLSQLGFLVTRQLAVSDEAEAIQTAVQEALGRSHLVITTGGLGPTSDDRTRDVLAALFQRRLVENAEVLARIQGYFQKRSRPMPESTRVQALVPEGAQVLLNANGTAPGLVLAAGAGLQVGQGAAGDERLLIMLPGPPRELQPMFTQQVVPLLRQRFKHPEPFHCRVLKSTGLGESMVEEKIAPLLNNLVGRGLEIGYCARFGEVDVRLTARGSEAEHTVNQAEAIVRNALGKHIFGYDPDQLEAVVVRALTARAESLALAESCTGGYIANRITNVPGASAVFLGGLVTYSNEAKQNLLGVDPALLAEHGAVSAPTACAMAEGAKARFGATYGIGVTGIAGPSGGTEDKPVGTVFMALAGPEPTVVLNMVNRSDRESFKFITSQQALDLLRRKISS